MCFKKKNARSSTQPNIPDWKKRVSEHERQAEETKQTKEEQFWVEEKLRMEQKRQLKMEKLMRFQCHICGVHSQGLPKIREHTSDGNINTGNTTSYEEDWSVPRDLERCRTCGKWVCVDCLYKEKCKDCWTKETGGVLGKGEQLNSE